MWHNNRPSNECKTDNNDVKSSQKEALDRILEKHMLYCTVCDYNNGDCEIHNTMDEWGIQHQTYEYKENLMRKIMVHSIVTTQTNVYYVVDVLKPAKT